MAGITDRNQRGQRIADDWQPQSRKPGCGERRQFEGQGNHLPPCLRALT